LKKYSGSKDCEDEDGNDDGSDGEGKNSPKEEGNKRGRTFSETLKLLDDDILAELNVN